MGATGLQKEVFYNYVKKRKGELDEFVSFSDNYFQVELDAYASIPDWYHYAIFELTYVKGFQSCPRWIGKSLGISSIEAQLAVERQLNLQEGVSGKYDLIPNDEWQSIARDIEAQNSGANSNWAVDANAQVIINRGHSSNSPAQSCDALHEYLGGNCGNSANTNDFLSKRTHNLSSPEETWDISGNVHEWVKDNSNFAYGVNSYLFRVTAESHPGYRSLEGGSSALARNAKDQFGPLGSYPGLNVGNYGGLGYGYLNYSSRSVLRGGGGPVGGEPAFFMCH